MWTKKKSGQFSANHHMWWTPAARNGLTYEHKREYEHNNNKGTCITQSIHLWIKFGFMMDVMLDAIDQATRPFPAWVSLGENHVSPNIQDITC